MTILEIILTIILITIDLLTKYLANTFLTNNITIIDKFFKLSLIHNEGASWSILEGKQILLIIVAFIVLFLLSIIKNDFEESKYKQIGFSLLYGGIIGNLLERIVFNYVTDYLSFTIFGYDYPIFNLADTFIVIGSIILIILSIKGGVSNVPKSRRKRKTR